MIQTRGFLLIFVCGKMSDVVAVCTGAVVLRIRIRPSRKPGTWSTRQEKLEPKNRFWLWKHPYFYCLIFNILKLLSTYKQVLYNNGPSLDIDPNSSFFSYHKLLWTLIYKILTGSVIYLCWNLILGRFWYEFRSFIRARLIIWKQSGSWAGSCLGSEYK